MAKKTVKKKKFYDVDVVRIGYGFKAIQVEAYSKKEAEDKALDEAGDYEYKENSSDYKVNGSRETTDRR